MAYNVHNEIAFANCFVNTDGTSDFIVIKMNS